MIIIFIFPDETHLAELKVILEVNTRRGSVHADRRGAGSEWFHARDTRAADRNLASKGGAGRDGREAHHGSHCSHSILVLCVQGWWCATMRKRSRFRPRFNLT